MEFLDHLAQGFDVSLSLANLGWCLLGVAIGTAVGVLPGLGPATTISLLLPVTFRMDSVSAVIMLSGIYYGAMYGGSITSILVRVPGEAASVVTCLDGYQMARRGRAGAALGIAAFASFAAGLLATLGIATVGPGVARYALAFGPPEYAALVLLGLVLVTLVSQTSMLRSLMMVAVGLLLSTVGLDPIFGVPRFTFDTPSLFDGIGIVVMAMGLFGVAELLSLAEQRPEQSHSIFGPGRVADLLPSVSEWRQSTLPILRGTGVGFALGILPGAGATMASFASYVLERRLSRTPGRFGHGAIEGVAGPEAANNAAAQASFVPLLTLGIPANAAVGVLMGALLIHGISPGPLLASERPDLFWGVITSMFIGNLMLIVLNVPLISAFVRLLRVPFAVLSPMILLFCMIGAYSLNSNTADVWLMVIFGIAGWLLRKTGFDPAPLLLAFVLGSVLERSIRQTLLIGHGSLQILLDRPIALTCIVLAVCVLVWPIGRRVIVSGRAPRTGRTPTDRVSRRAPAEGTSDRNGTTK